MKGVILAGGQGTRLRPLTELINKHLLPVGQEPMIWHAVKQMVSADIQRILVITATEHVGDIVNSLGSGERFRCNFTYKVQEKPLGIAHALSLAEDFVNGDKCVVLLGDNIFERSIADHVNLFRKQKYGARVLLKKVSEPERFGIAALDEKHIVDIKEKPTHPASQYAVVGCYMYDAHVFEFIKSAKPSRRGELEITSINNQYIALQNLEYGFVQGKWMDAGTFESLSEANKILLAHGNKIL